MSKRSTLLVLLGLNFIGIVAALLGDFLLSSSQAIVYMIKLFAGGGILYLGFHDIVTLSTGKHEWIPATAASIGFILGMIGEKLLL